jgi:hypothetical protein
MNDAKASETVSQLIAERAKQRPAFLETIKTDQLVDALMRLSMEVSVIRERMDIYEDFFDKLGIGQAEIEGFVASAELEEKRFERRQLLVSQIIRDVS